MRLPHPGMDRKQVVASQPHGFEAIHDPGLVTIAAGSAGAGVGLGSITSVVVADNYIRKSRCGVPGCGKDLDDPIHTAGRE